MAAIEIYELYPAGSELFSDSESYMNDLSDKEIGIQGGMIPKLIPWWTHFSPWCGPIDTIQPSCPKSFPFPTETSVTPSIII